MALTDILRTRRSNKIHQHAWAAIWDEVRTPPEGDVGAKELHVLFVGTLLYATRYQAALTAGMEDSIARTVALQVVVKADFDQEMRDELLSVFSKGQSGEPTGYAPAVTPLITAVVADAAASGTVPLGAEVDETIAQIKALLPVLAHQLQRQHQTSHPSAIPPRPVGPPRDPPKA